jgi:hypothetical protein
MEIQTLTDLAPAVVAIVGPWLTFRYALRREQRQWSREQRAQVYIDLLVDEDEAQRNIARIYNERAFEALAAQIRLELESEHGVPWWRRPKKARDPMKGTPPPLFRNRPPSWAPPDGELDDEP